MWFHQTLVLQIGNVMISISSCAPPTVHLRYSQNVIIWYDLAPVGVDYNICHQGLSNTPEPQIYLRLMVKILASLVLESSTFVNISLHFKPFMGKLRFFCDFGQCQSGVWYNIQYTPVCHLLRVYLVSNSTYLYPRIQQRVLSRSQ